MSGNFDNRLEIPINDEVAMAMARWPRWGSLPPHSFIALQDWFGNIGQFTLGDVYLVEATRLGLSVR